MLETVLVMIRDMLFRYFDQIECMSLKLPSMLLTNRPLRLEETGHKVVVAGWLVNVQVTCLCVSGKAVLRQVYVLPHCDLLILLAISISHTIMTPSQAVLALAL